MNACPACGSYFWDYWPTEDPNTMAARCMNGHDFFLVDGFAHPQEKEKGAK